MAVLMRSAIRTQTSTKPKSTIKTNLIYTIVNQIFTTNCVISNIGIFFFFFEDNMICIAIIFDSE